MASGKEPVKKEPVKSDARIVDTGDFREAGVEIDPVTGEKNYIFELWLDTSPKTSPRAEGGQRAPSQVPLAPKQATANPSFDPMTDAVVASRLRQTVREQAQKKLDDELRQVQLLRRVQSPGKRLPQTAAQSVNPYLPNLPAALPYLAPITASIPGVNVLTNVLNAQRTLEMADQAFPAFGRGRRYVQGLVQGALDRVSGAPVNFTQGAVAHGMDRYEAALERGEIQPSESALWNAVQMAPYLVGDVVGNVRAGASAAWNNSGAKQIGDRVPELAENTLGGMAYNTLTRMASDPTNLIGARRVVTTPGALVPLVRRVFGNEAAARAVATSALAHLAQDAPVLSSLSRAAGRVSRATAGARALEAAERGSRGNGRYRAVFVSPQQRAGAAQARGYGDPVFYPAGQRPVAVEGDNLGVFIKGKKSGNSNKPPHTSNSSGGSGSGGNVVGGAATGTGSSTAPRFQTVDQATQWLKSKGVDPDGHDLIHLGDVNTANLICDALDHIASIPGMSYPYGVIFDAPTFADKKMENVLAAMQNGIVALNPRSKYWQDPQSHATELYTQGFWSTDHIYHPFFHEAGHWEMFNIRKMGYVYKLHTTPLTGETTAIASSVSEYATSNMGDFLSEVFALLLAKKPVPKEAMQLYRRNGGIIP